MALSNSYSLFLNIDFDDNDNNNHQLLMSRYKTLLIVHISKQRQMKSVTFKQWVIFK